MPQHTAASLAVCSLQQQCSGRTSLGAQGQVQHYVYVSSAGAYVPGPYYPELAEGDERKASAGHVEVENYLEEQVRSPSLRFTVKCLV